MSGWGRLVAVIIYSFWHLLLNLPFAICDHYMMKDQYKEAEMVWRWCLLIRKESDAWPPAEDHTICLKSALLVSTFLFSKGYRKEAHPSQHRSIPFLLLYWYYEVVSLPYTYSSSPMSTAHPECNGHIICNYWMNSKCPRSFWRSIRTCLYDSKFILVLYSLWWPAEK